MRMKAIQYILPVAHSARYAPQVQPNGEVGQALDALQPGDKLAIKGPFGKYVYKPGKFKAIGAAPHCGGFWNSEKFCHRMAQVTWSAWGGHLVQNQSGTQQRGGSVLGLHMEQVTLRALRCAGLLAGGTGLTPMIRLIHTILSNLEDRVKVCYLLQQKPAAETAPRGPDCMHMMWMACSLKDLHLLLGSA